MDIPHYIAAGVAGVIVLSALKQHLFPTLRPIPLGTDHPLLADATRKAQASLETFRRFVAERPGPCIVKFPLLTNQQVVEHVWAELIEWRGDTMLIQYESVPVTQTAPLDRRVERSTSELEDWAVVRPDGRMVGGFSQRAMIQAVREQEKKPRWGLRRRLAIEEARFVNE
jgi:uncharacterized protein YegJ (DUF2314 family)